jgi:hypothetical protein
MKYIKKYNEKFDWKKLNPFPEDEILDIKGYKIIE